MQEIVESTQKSKEDTVVESLRMTGIQMACEAIEIKNKSSEASGRSLEKQCLERINYIIKNLQITESMIEKANSIRKRQGSQKLGVPGGGTKYFMGQPQSKLYKTVEIKNKTNFDAFLNEWFVKGKNIIHLTLM